MEERRSGGLFGEAHRSTAESQSRLAKNPRAKEIARAQRARDSTKRSAKVNGLVEQIRERRKNPKAELHTIPMVLTTVPVVPPVVLPPENIAIYGIVPKATEYPTARLVGTDQSAQPSLPWSVVPEGFVLPALVPVIGTIAISLGKSLILAIATKELSKALGGAGGLGFTLRDSRYNVRVHTGRGEGRGAYQSLRGEGGGKADDDADPYDQPSEWYEFWKWSF